MGSFPVTIFGHHRNTDTVGGSPTQLKLIQRNPYDSVDDIDHLSDLGRVVISWWVVLNTPWKLLHAGLINVLSHVSNLSIFVFTYTFYI